jgi:hypothetical protein
MFRIYCDGILLYHSNLESLKIFDPSLELELNKTGSFVFTVYPDHPRYSLVKRMKSIIQVWQDDFLLFCGRVLDEEVGWHNEKTFICEGELAYLLDTIQRPYDFSGSIPDFLGMLLSNHNAQADPEKRFALGNVTVTDPNDYIVRSDIDYTNTWEVINKKLIELLGGFLQVRHVGGVTYLDYLKESTLLAPQKITFGKNLLDLKRTRKGEDIATVIIPLGAKLKDEEGQDTDRRLTIESVNGGVDFVQDSDAIAQFGIIVKTVIFDDVTDPSNMKTKGEAHLSDSVNQWESIELSAADLATVDKDITSFHLGTMVDVVSEPHGLNQRFLVTKLSLKLLDPAANKMMLGKTIQAFSEAVKGIFDSQGLILQTVEKTAQVASEAVYNVEQNLMSSIQVAEQNIQSIVSENYYLKDDTDALISSVSTEIEQTKNSMEIQFNQFSADIEAVAAGVDAEFEEQRKYIRFEDGNIIQGAEGSPFQKVQSATRESYFDSGKEVAYFSNQMLHVTDGEFTHSLRSGKFAFVPRANGNLSFKKVVD